MTAAERAGGAGGRLAGVARHLVVATPGALVLPALATLGAPVHTSIGPALLGPVIAGLVFVPVARVADGRALAPAGVAMAAVSAWLLSQASSPEAAWAIAPGLGAGLAFASPGALPRPVPRAVIPGLAVALGLIATGLLAGRGLTITAGATAIAIAAALSGLAGPRRMRLGTNTVALGLGGLAVVMLTAAYIGATTPTAGWFGSVVSHGPRDGAEVAISFDDGPNPPYTLQIRDILDAYGAKGTFFTVGEALDARPDVSRALMEGGHLLANHSYHHDAFRWLDPRYPELEATQAAFERNLDVCPTLFRPPHGNHTPFMARAVHRKGMKMVTWDVSAGDWATDDAALVAQRVLDDVRPGSIILLHDGIDGNIGADRSVVVAALPLILDGLRARGLRPVTLDRLLGVPGYLPDC